MVRRDVSFACCLLSLAATLCGAQPKEDLSYSESADVIYWEAWQQEKGVDYKECARPANIPLTLDHCYTRNGRAPAFEGECICVKTKPSSLITLKCGSDGKWYAKGSRTAGLCPPPLTIDAINGKIEGTSSTDTPVQHDGDYDFHDVIGDLLISVIVLAILLLICVIVITVFLVKWCKRNNKFCYNLDAGYIDSTEVQSLPGPPPNMPKSGPVYLETLAVNKYDELKPYQLPRPSSQGFPEGVNPVYDEINSQEEPKYDEIQNISSTNLLSVPDQ